MNVFRLGILTLLLVLITTVSASAETYFRATGLYIPGQDIEINEDGPSGGIPSVTIESDNSFGAAGEVGFYSPNKMLSFGAEGSFEKLTSFNPVTGSGIERVEANVYSILGKMCANVQNRSKITPFACGGAGMTFVDASAELGSGAAKLNFTNVSTPGYALEAGISYQASKDLALRAGYRRGGTFTDPVISIDGAPGTGFDLNLDRNIFFLSAEF